MALPRFDHVAWKPRKVSREQRDIRTKRIRFGDYEQVVPLGVWNQRSRYSLTFVYRFDIIAAIRDWLENRNGLPFEFLDESLGPGGASVLRIVRCLRFERTGGVGHNEVLTAQFDETPTSWR